MFNIHALFPQLSVFGYFGPSPYSTESNPFLDVYVENEGELGSDEIVDSFLF